MSETTEPDTLATIRDKLERATAASKCWRCGCFQETVTALEGSAALAEPLSDVLARGRERFTEQAYACLGCDECWPAEASALLADIDPGAAEAAHCPTDPVTERPGWPPLPGDHRVLRYAAPVAVCLLNSEDLLASVAEAATPGLAIAGTLHTENLGIERLVRNILPNPHIRFVLLAGADTRRRVGHKPGQSLRALLHEGVDDNHCIIGAEGKRPVLKNLAREEIEAFRDRITLVDRRGETDPAVLAERITEAAAEDPGPDPTGPRGRAPAADTVAPPERFRADPAGYFVVYPDHRHNRLVLEHYGNDGVLTTLLAGPTPAALYTAAADRGLLSRLDHAAYLGRELAQAEAALRDGTAYEQDAAPGEEADSQPVQEDKGGSCGWGPSCC